MPPHRANKTAWKILSNWTEIPVQYDSARSGKTPTDVFAIHVRHDNFGNIIWESIKWKTKPFTWLAQLDFLGLFLNLLIFKKGKLCIISL